MRVEDTSAATTKATRIATSLGGYAQSVNYNSAPGGGGTASITLRVPAQNVKAALARLEGLGTLVSQNLSVTDLEHDLQLESAQIAQLRRTIAALRTALNDPSLPESQRVILQIRLAESKRALSQRLHARTGTITAGTTSSISLFLSTKAAAVPIPHHRGRLGRMVHSAIGFLGLEGTIVLYALIVVSPIFHGFWAVPPEQAMAQQINFMKNISILGGMLVLFAFGPGRYSVDQTPEVGARRG